MGSPGGLGYVCWNCNVVTMVASADSMGISEAGVALVSYPRLGVEHWAFIPPGQSCGLPWKEAGSFLRWQGAVSVRLSWPGS
jgi:hypothetical protein